MLLAVHVCAHGAGVHSRVERCDAMLCSASCEGEATVRGLFPRSVAGGALGGAVSLGFRLGGGCGFECSVA